MEEQTKAEGTVSLKKSTIWQIVSGVLGVLLVISIFTSGFGFGIRRKFSWREYLIVLFSEAQLWNGFK